MRKHYNVAIIGGGAAGIAAAAAAAKYSSKVVLIDSNTVLGGMATRAYVGTICGIAPNHIGHSGNPQIMLPGFGGEFVTALADHSKSEPRRNRSGMVFLPYKLESFTSVTKTVLSALPNLDLELASSVTTVEFDPINKYFQVSLLAERQSRSFDVDRIVDCSGHAIPSKLLGIEYIKVKNPQVSAIVFRLSNLPPFEEEHLALTIKKEILSAAQIEELDIQKFEISYVPGSYRDRSAYFKLALPDVRTPEGGNNKTFKAAAINRLKKIDGIIKSSEVLKGTIISFVATDIGVRSGDRGKGLYILEESDIVTSKKFPDGIAMGFWPVEDWQEPRSPIIKHQEDRGYYTVPLGAIRSANNDKLFFAGKSISASDVASSSSRVIGTCLATGWAAGAFAGMSCNEVPESEILKIVQSSQIK